MLKTPPPLLLASSSRYRAELLGRLRLSFTTQAPDIDETPRRGESAQALVTRLAAAKAVALRAAHPQAWIIGSDQAAAIGDEIVGKPGSRDAAIRQLLAASGREVRFLTAVCLSTPNGMHQDLDVTTVRFLELARDQIERYVDAEPAFDCAGAFKCEAYGISLFEAIDSQDPTALVGLPLIGLCRLLRAAGYPLP